VAGCIDVNENAGREIAEDTADKTLGCWGGARVIGDADRIVFDPRAGGFSPTPI